METKPVETPEVKKQENETLEFPKGTIVLERYQIIKEIGRGGMNSIIYLAEDINVDKNDYFGLQNKNVAIKVVTRNDTVSDSEWNKFLDECVTSNRASNLPNIVKTYQVSKINNDKTIIIIMEYVDGISLRKYLNTHGYLSVKESIFIFDKILAALKELHGFKQKIIHRDLKPENILLSHDLRKVKIIDFGISSVLQIEDSNEKKVLTDENALYGTYPYISPDIYEMIDSKNNIDGTQISEQFDFYSIGVILFEMLTGRKPFLADNYNSQEVIKLPLKYDFPVMSDLNPNVSPMLENIIFRCMASKPEDKKYRYHSVQDIINDVKLYNSGNPNNINVKLLKPRKNRTLQNKNVFDVDRQKEKENFYDKWWFVLTIALCTLCIVIITIVLRQTLD